MNCFVRIYKEEGVLSYWKGNGINVLRYFPTTALNFAFKDFFNRRFENSPLRKTSGGIFFTNVLSGGMAGSCCMTFVYPLEFARTRLGVDVGKKGTTQYKGVLDCF